MQISKPKAIRYEFDYLHQEFNEIIDSILHEIEKSTVDDLFGKILSKKLKRKLNRIQKRSSKNFSLAVIGEFKRGKSTLINALLGESLVPTNITPETVTVNQIDYGNEYSLEAKISDGAWIPLDFNDLESEKLIPLLDTLPHQIDCLRIHAPIKELKGLSIIDTPGTGDIFNRFDTAVNEALDEADVVLFVISALAPLSESERAFLQGSVLPKDFPKVFFIINMMDITRTEDEACRLLSSITKKLNQSFPKSRVFGVSALDEICRLQSNPSPNSKRASDLREDFTKLRQAINQTIYLNKDLILLHRATIQSKLFLKELEIQLSLLRHSLQESQANLGYAITQCEDKSSDLFIRIASHKENMRQDIRCLSEQACSWIEEFIFRFEKEVISDIGRFKITDIRRYYHFFLTDILQQAMSKCLESHYSSIAKSAEKTIKVILEDYKNIVHLSDTESKIESITFDELPWNTLDTLELIAEFSPLKFVSGLLIHQTKELKESKQIESYQKKLKHAIPTIRQSILKQIRSIYADIANELECKIEDVYKKEIEESLSTLRQAQALCLNNSSLTKAQGSSLSDLSNNIQDWKNHIELFQSKIWSSLDH